MKTPPLPSGWKINADGFLLNPHDAAGRWILQSDGKIDRLLVATVLSNYHEAEHALLWQGAVNEVLLEALRAMLETALKCDDKAWAEAVGRAGTFRPCDLAAAAIAAVSN